MPSLKAFREESSNVKTGVGALRALSSVMVLLNRYLLIKLCLIFLVEVVMFDH